MVPVCNGVDAKSTSSRKSHDRDNHFFLLNVQRPTSQLFDSLWKSGYLNYNVSKAKPRTWKAINGIPHIHVSVHRLGALMERYEQSATTGHEIGIFSCDPKLLLPLYYGALCWLRRTSATLTPGFPASDMRYMLSWR
jgi:hypothetical protein